jgi:hypothetical protein
MAAREREEIEHRRKLYLSDCPPAQVEGRTFPNALWASAADRSPDRRLSEKYADFFYGCSNGLRDTMLIRFRSAVAKPPWNLADHSGATVVSARESIMSEVDHPVHAGGHLNYAPTGRIVGGAVGRCCPARVGAWHSSITVAYFGDL